MENENIKVLIVVKGGTIQSIYSSQPKLNFEIVDFDNLELCKKDEEFHLTEKSEDFVPIY